MRAKDIMSTDVVTISEKETVAEAAAKMVSFAVSGCPVLSARGSLSGIFSETDVLRVMKQTVSEEVGVRYMSSPEHSLALLGLMSDTFPDIAEKIMTKLRGIEVGSVMTKRVITASPEDSVEDVVGLMVRHDVNRIPIIEGGKVVGVVSRADIARYVARRR
jgi:CBS domain-containing protein